MISLSPTNNMYEVKELLGSDDLWKRFSDGVEYEDYTPENTDCDQWLLIHNYQDLMGVILVRCESSCAISFHPYMLKQYRRFAREMIAGFFEWFMADVPKVICKINISIPDCYQSAINAGKKMGFKKEGVNRSSYNVNGIVYNQIMSGITRKEVQDVLAR